MGARPGQRRIRDQRQLGRQPPQRLCVIIAGHALTATATAASAAAAGATACC